MTATLKRGIVLTYRAFSGRPNTLTTQFLILTILGAMTITGMSYVARHENRTTGPAAVSTDSR